MTFFDGEPNDARFSLRTVIPCDNRKMAGFGSRRSDRSAAKNVCAQFHRWENENGPRGAETSFSIINVVFFFRFHLKKESIFAVVFGSFPVCDDRSLNIHVSVAAQ